MWTIKYQSTVWELNDWVMAELTAQGIVNSPASQNNPASLTDKFCDDWGYKTHEAFVIAVAVTQSLQSMEEEFDLDNGSVSYPELENSRSNIVDAITILQGGQI